MVNEYFCNGGDPNTIYQDEMRATGEVTTNFLLGNTFLKEKDGIIGIE